MDGPVIIAFRPVCNAAIVICFGIVRVQGNRFIVVLNGPIIIAFRPVCIAATVIGLGQVRFPFNRFGVVLDGAVKIAPLVCLNSIAEIFLGIRNIVGHIVSLGVGKANKIWEEGFFMDVVYFFQFLPYLGFAFRFDDYLFRRQLL